MGLRGVWRSQSYRITKLVRDARALTIILKHKIMHHSGLELPNYANIVIIGCPRSGTTILNLIFKYTMVRSLGWDFEMRATDPYISCITRENPDRIVVTKHTDEWEDVDKIRWVLPGVRFVYLWRDPASNLSSRMRDHEKYILGPEKYIKAYKVMKSQQGNNYFHVVKFRDLVTRPDEVQTKIEEVLGVGFTVPFSEAWREIPKTKPPKASQIGYYWTAKDENGWNGKDDRREEFVKLSQHVMAGGIRPFDPSVITKWKRDPDKIERVREAFNRFPILKRIDNEYHSGLNQA